MHHISRRLSLSYPETSSLARGSYVWLPRRSSGAASSAVAASDDEAPKSCKKKVTRAERKSMLESFVNNYRAMNSGKFPSANMVKKEVGGGYYAVRKAIQEMEFKTRKSCTRLNSQDLKTEVKNEKEKLIVENAGEKSKLPEAHIPFARKEIFDTELFIYDSSSVTSLEEKEVAREINLSTEKDPVSCSLMIDEEIKVLPHTSDSKNVPPNDVGEKPSKCDASVSKQNDHPGKSVVSSATDDKTDVITKTKRSNMSEEESRNIATTPETSDVMKEKMITLDDRQHESSKTDDAARDMSREHDGNAESPKKAFAWNLKSLADGIINFWRNL